jgi:hypothetical protein
MTIARCVFVAVPESNADATVIGVTARDVCVVAVYETGKCQLATRPD